jgi:UDP-N-acetylglucosamine:LPS N-acetylglucosamine transferase
MVEWLTASDVLVHSTGGLTVLEAIMLGCPAVSYGWGRGHVRVNNQAYRDFGLADVVSRRDELGSAIVRALERRRTPVEEFGQLPSAASCVLALTSSETR